MDENDVMLSESQDDASTVQIIEVEESSDYDVESFEAFPALTGSATNNHALLDNREISDQHPIVAITGLREELDEIESLKTVYSDKIGVANYYEWYEGAYDECGYFVSLVPHTSTIKICDRSDIFGVTVDCKRMAGFIGGQNEQIPRGNNYGLVVTSGVVDVRCESDVAEGDYVVSNSNGVAEKTTVGYGYKVIAVEEQHGVNYAVISLGVQADQTHSLGAELDLLDTRLDNAEININIAMNVANVAYSKAADCVTSNDAMSDKVDNALGVVDGVVSDVENMGAQVENSMVVSAQAKAIAESAATSAISIKDEAVKTANESLAMVEDLKEQGKALYEWENPDDPTKTGVAYYVEYINEEGIKTRGEIDDLQTQDAVHNSAILRNGKSIESLVSSVDKYTIGEYSQAHGLTLEQARSILKKDMIYIPIKQGQATYTHEEKYDDGTEQTPTFSFSCGFYYIWDGKWWLESNTKCVALPYIEELGDNVPAGSDALKFWFIDSETAPEGYEPMALYMWTEAQDDGGETVWQWVKVNTLAGNVNNRITSMIRQTAEEISAEVVNARGSSATLGLRLTDTESEIQSLALWSKGGDENGEQYNLATIKQTADDAGASVAQVAAQICSEYITINGSWSATGKATSKVYYTTADEKYWYYKDGNWKSTDYPTEAGLVVNAASIVLAINNDKTSAKISADRVDIDASDFEVNADNIDLHGYITANGAFEIDDNGYMHATKGGTIGGFTIGDKSIYNNQTGYNDTKSGVYLGTDGIGLGAGKFYVTSGGYLHTTSGKVGGWNISTDTIKSNNVSLYSGSSNTAASLISEGTHSPCRISLGRGEYKTYRSEWITVGKNGSFTDISFTVPDVFLNNASVLAETAINLNEVKNLTYQITGNEILVSGDVYCDGTPVSDNVRFIVSYNVPALFMLDDGSLYANATSITGSITASSGTIGGWNINSYELWYNAPTPLNWTDLATLSYNFLAISDSDFGFSVGPASMRYVHLKELIQSELIITPMGFEAKISDYNNSSNNSDTGLVYWSDVKQAISDVKYLKTEVTELKKLLN